MTPTDSRFERRKVAVTGAGGFIGNAVCAALSAEGADVRGLELNSDAADRVRASGAAFEQCDVVDRAALDRCLGGADSVVHTAAHVREWGDMDDFVRVNVRGTRNVLDAAARAGADRVVHVSSVVVYGYDAPGEQDDDVFHRTYGIPYIDTKSASDALACRRGAVVIRPGDVYGPHSVPWALRPLELARANQLAVPGDGDGVMLPVYIDDLVEAVALGLLEGKPGRPYTAWSGEPVTFEDYFNRFAGMVGGRPARRLPRPLLAAVAGAIEAVAALRGAPPAFSRNAITFIDAAAPARPAASGKSSGGSRASTSTRAYGARRSGCERSGCCSPRERPRAPHLPVEVGRLTPSRNASRKDFV